MLFLVHSLPLNLILAWLKLEELISLCLVTENRLCVRATVRASRNLPAAPPGHEHAKLARHRHARRVAEEPEAMRKIRHCVLASVWLRTRACFSLRTSLLIIYSESVVKIPIRVASGDAQGNGRGRGGGGGRRWGPLSGSSLSHTHTPHTSSNMLRPFPGE